MLNFPEAVQTASLTGTVSTTAGSTTVTGVGTTFLVDLKGTAFGTPSWRQTILVGSEIRDVLQIISDTSLLVEYPFANTNSGVTYTRLDAKSNRIVDSFHPLPVVLTSATGGGPLAIGGPAPLASIVRIEDGAGGALTSVRPGNADAVSATLSGIQTEAELAAFNGTTYDRLRSLGLNVDAITPATLGALLSAAAQLLFNGTTFDRARSQDLTVDAQIAATVGVMKAAANLFLFNGTTFDRARSQDLTVDGQVPTNVGAMKAGAATFLFNGTGFDRARSQDLTADGVIATGLGAMRTAAMTYGFNGTTFDRLLSQGLTTDSVVAAALGALKIAAANYLFNGTTFDRHRALSGLGAGLGTAAVMQPRSQVLYNAANNGVVTLTFAGVAGQAHYLTGLIFSYDGAPAPAGGVTITNGPTTLGSYDVVLGGTVVIHIPPGGIGTGILGDALVVTLAASGITGVTGKVTAMKVTY